MSQLHAATCDFVIQIGVTPPGYGYSNILSEMIRLWCHNPFSSPIVCTTGRLVLHMAASNNCSNIGPSLQWYFNNLGSYKHYCLAFSTGIVGEETTVSVVWLGKVWARSLYFILFYFDLCWIKKSNVKCDMKWWYYCSFSCNINKPRSVILEIEFLLYFA